jgi:biopolymer transport protein ExbB
MLSTILLQVTQSATPVIDTLNKVSNIGQTTQAPSSISLFDFIVKGGPIMIPIGILSVLTVYIFFERFFTIKKAAKIDNNFMASITDYMRRGQLEEAKSLCRNTNSAISRMILKGISRIGKPIKEIEGAVENVGKLEVHKLEKNMGILGIIAGIAPMLGFVGTIIGVIKIFYNISLADNISIGLIAGGLYEKMVTSASGLIIGIVAYIGYHYLAIMADKVIFQMESKAVDFIDLLQEPTS